MAHHLHAIRNSHRRSNSQKRYDRISNIYQSRTHTHTQTWSAVYAVAILLHAYDETKQKKNCISVTETNAIVQVKVWHSAHTMCNGTLPQFVRDLVQCISTELTDVTVDVNWNWSSIASVYWPPNDAYVVAVANNFHIIASYSFPNAQNQIVVITNPSMIANHIDLHKNQNQIKQIYQLQNQLPWHNQPTHRANLCSTANATVCER